MTYFARYQGDTEWTEMCGQRCANTAAKAFVEFTSYHVRDTFLVEVKESTHEVELFKVHVEGYLTVHRVE